MTNPIQSAICSFGMSGKVFHAPFLHVHQGFRFYGAWERSTKTVNKLYPEVKSFETLQQMLADETIELVIVNTPNATHYDYAKQALLAGKHVLVEKPFVVTTAEAEDLIRIADEKKVVLTVYQNRRFDSDYTTVKSVLNEGLLGEIREAEIHFDRYKPELSPKLHKETPGPGTGVVYDLGSHIIDQALQLFGMPTSLFADITTMRPDSQVDDYLEILFYYPEKRVRLKATYFAREPVPAYIFHGTTGSFLKSRADIQEPELVAGNLPGTPDWGVEPEAEQGLLHTEVNGATIRQRRPTMAGNYLDFFEELYLAIREGGAPPASGEDGRNVIRIIEVSKQSSETKKVVELSR